MYYLAIDIGASSGRHILGKLNNGILDTKEESLLRIANRVKKGGHNIDTEAVSKRLWLQELIQKMN